MSTIILDGLRCHSACAFVYFAGHERGAFGELGVHQVWNEQNDAVATQVKLSDVLEALTEFAVSQPIISVMLRTPPEDMHVFSKSQVASFGINVGVPHRHLALAGKTTGKEVAAREASARKEAERRSAEQAEIERLTAEADIERRAAEAAAREAYEREGSEQVPREGSSVPSPPNTSDVEGEVIWEFSESAGGVSCSVSINTRKLFVLFMYTRGQDQPSASLNTGAIERQPRMNTEWVLDDGEPNVVSTEFDYRMGSYVSTDLHPRFLEKLRNANTARLTLPNGTEFDLEPVNGREAMILLLACQQKEHASSG